VLSRSAESSGSRQRSAAQSGSASAGRVGQAMAGDLARVPCRKRVAGAALRCRDAQAAARRDGDADGARGSCASRGTRTGAGAGAGAAVAPAPVAAAAAMTPRSCAPRCTDRCCTRSGRADECRRPRQHAAPLVLGALPLSLKLRALLCPPCERDGALQPCLRRRRRRALRHAKHSCFRAQRWRRGRGFRKRADVARALRQRRAARSSLRLLRRAPLARDTSCRHHACSSQSRLADLVRARQTAWCRR
jgi:hypothetical protein